MRKTFLGESDSYNAFKADVFALGATLFSMSALDSGLELTDFLPNVDNLDLSDWLKGLLRDMLKYSEEERLTMKQVVDRVGERRNAVEAQERDMADIVSVSKDKVRTFNPHRMMWDTRKLKSEIAVDAGSRYIWVESNLFCSGGNSYPGWGTDHSGLAATYLLSGSDWHVRQGADMLIPRSDHGLVWLPKQQSVLIFGGCCEPDRTESLSADDPRKYGELRECEALNLHTNEQKRLPCMQEPRSRFNPCVFSGFIYLCGWGSDLIEVYDPYETRFYSLQPRLPEKFSPCCVFVAYTEMVVVSGQYVTRWQSAAHRDLTQVSIHPHTTLNLRCNLPPILSETQQVVYLSYNGFCYSLKTDGSVVRIIGIPN